MQHFHPHQRPQGPVYVPENGNLQTNKWNLQNAPSRPEQLKLTERRKPLLKIKVITSIEY
jgi:hypothetical protein